MKVAVIGAGYVGLTTALLMNLAHEVDLIECDKDKLNSLKNGKSTINEDLTQQYLNKSRLNYYSFLPAFNYDFIFICVGTPTKFDGSLDMQYVESVMDSIKVHSESLVIIKSTINLGDTERLQEIYKDLRIVFSPEFLRESTAMHDALHPNRLVFGFSDESELYNLNYKFMIKDLYKNIIPGFSKLSIFTLAPSAELIKLASNSYLAVRLSYFNEINRLCDATGANMEDVRKGMCSDPRIGFEYSTPSIGFSGPCLPKDTKALYNLGLENGVDMKTLKGAIYSNSDNFLFYFNKVRDIMKINKFHTILFLGIAFKPYSDDVRTSLPYKLYNLLKDEYECSIYDPRAGYKGIYKCEYDLLIKSTTEYDNEYVEYKEIVIIS